MTKLKIAAIAGSLSQQSLNKLALSAFIQRFPDGVTCSVIDLAAIPMYNSDLTELPSAVSDLKDQIAHSDAVVLATPEYNYGIPGVLKNALDWASRPAYQSVFAHKPVTMLGASPGGVGTARAQGQLKQVLLGMIADIYPCPELTIGLAKTKLDATGNVLDPKLDELITRHASGFVTWVETRLRSSN